MTAAESRSREPKLLDAGGFQPEISSFRLHLAAEGKAAKTVRTYNRGGAVVRRRAPAPAGQLHANGTGRPAGRAAVDRVAAGTASVAGRAVQNGVI
jgi:hypothetical protein